MEEASPVPGRPPPRPPGPDSQAGLRRQRGTLVSSPRTCSEGQACQAVPLRCESRKHRWTGLVTSGVSGGRSGPAGGSADTRQGWRAASAAWNGTEGTEMHAPGGRRRAHPQRASSAANLGQQIHVHGPSPWCARHQTEKKWHLTTKRRCWPPPRGAPSERCPMGGAERGRQRGGRQ